MLRTIMVPQETQWTVQFPQEYLHRKIEILIFPCDEEQEPEQTDEDTRLFWESFGSWQDDRTAEEIIADIYASRTSTERTLLL